MTRQVHYFIIRIVQISRLLANYLLVVLFYTSNRRTLYHIIDIISSVPCLCFRWEVKIRG